MTRKQVEFTKWLKDQDTEQPDLFYRSLRDSTIKNLCSLDESTLHKIFVPTMRYIIGMTEEQPAPPTTGIPQLDSLCANLQQQMIDDNFELCQAPTLSKKFGGSYGRYKRWSENHSCSTMILDEFQDYYRILSDAYGRKPTYDEIQSAYDSDMHAASQQQQTQAQDSHIEFKKVFDYEEPVDFEKVIPLS